MCQDGKSRIGWYSHTEMEYVRAEIKARTLLQSLLMTDEQIENEAKRTQARMERLQMDMEAE